MKVEAIDHLHLLVPDLQQVGVLFGALIGGEFTERYGGEPWNAWAVYYTVGSMEIMEPIRRQDPIIGGHRGDRMGIYGMAFRVNDLDAGIPEAQKAGLRLRSRVGSEDVGFGKWIIQAQFETPESFGTTIELAQRQRPDDPLYSAFRQLIDHVEFYVHDLQRAVALFSQLTGFPYPAPTFDPALQATSTINALGVKITQPAAADSPVARSLASRGEGVRTLALTTANLEQGIATAQKVGLRLVSRSGGPVGEAQFDPHDTFDVTFKLVEQRAA